MPATASDDGVVLGLKFDISRVKQTLDQVKNMVRDMAADSAKAVSKTDDTLEKARKNAEKWKIEPSTKGIEAAQKELDILNATIVNQQNELSNCEREHERLADKYGETSSQALKLEKRMLSLQASIEKNTKKSDDFGAALADAQDVMDAASGSAEDLEKNAKGAGKGMEDGGKGAKTFDVALGTLAGNALSAVIGKCGELMEQTKELRRDLSFLEQNARDAGMGMEQLHNKAGELYAVTGDTNEVVDAAGDVIGVGADVIGFLSELNPAVVLVSGGLALIAVKAAGTALGMRIVATGTASATKALAAAGPTAAAAGSQFVMLAADLLMVGAAVFLVTSGIAMLISAIRGVPMINTGTIQVPSMGELQAQVGGAGYARGTRSATPGWRWVGENGPELMRFAGGEAVYTAEQSRALISAQGGGTTFVDNSQNIFKVDDIETYVAIKRMLENEKMTVRMGLARR